MPNKINGNPTLPQPKHKSQKKYLYIPHGYAKDNVSEKDENDYMHNDDILEYFPSSQPYPRDTLCWVLKGKGTRQKTGTKRKNSQLFLRARVVEDKVGLPSTTDRAIQERQLEGGEKNIQDEDQRVLIRYSKGSTYKVRKSNLIPVLENGKIDDRIVLVLPETHDYRRASIVHTCIGENFLEIGCDFGCTVDRVQHALLQEDEKEKEQRGINQTCDNPPYETNNKMHTVLKKEVIALGIDKSPESIAIAQERYPHCLFSIEDALTKEGSAQIRTLCQKNLKNRYPSVVSVDINGNRELPAVLECIERIMCPEFDDNKNSVDYLGGEKGVSKLKCNGIEWDLPRLIIVKSRTLHELLMSRKQMDL